MTKAASRESLRERWTEGWRALVTLVKMQLKEKLDLSYMRTKRGLIFKSVWLLIEFAAITALLYLVFHFVKIMSIFSLTQDIPVSVIAIIWGIMLALSIITDTVGLMKALYFSKDNTVLLTFPATPSLIFLSKLATYYIYEIRKSFMFTIPMFIAFGMAKGYGILYYPWLLLMFVLISIVPVLISALLSIPSMYLYVFLNRVKLLQYVLYIAVGVLGILALWQLIDLIPEDINFVETWGETYWDIQDMLKSFTERFSAIYLFTELIVGRTVGLTSRIFHSGTLPSLLILIGVSICLFILCFTLSKPLFCKMASTPFEFTKKNSILEKRNRAHSPFASALKKELISGMRSNHFIKLGGILIVIMPMAIQLLNKIYSAMNTRFLGTQMTISFNVFIILLMLLMTNIDIASVYSRDGSSSYLNKVQPAPYSLLLISKLVFPMIISAIGVIVTMLIFHSFYSIVPNGAPAGTPPQLSTLDTVMIGVTVYAVYIAHLFSSAESDIMNPQYEQYATFSEQANNPNESTSAILTVLISALVFIVSLFLSSGSTSGVWTKLALVTLAAAAFKVATYLMKIKVFYKEKQ